MTLPPRPEWEAGFHAWWTWTCRALDAAIGPRVSYLNREAQRSGLGKILYDAYRQVWDGDVEGVYTTNQLAHLAFDLEDIAAAAPEACDALTSRLRSRNTNQAGTLRGVWFEARMTALILSKGFAFTSPEPPDFRIQIKGAPVNVECYSPKAAPGDEVRDLATRAIRRKAKMYRGRRDTWFTSERTILLMDATLMKSVEWAGPDEASDRQAVAWGISDALDAGWDLVVGIWYGVVLEGKDHYQAKSIRWGPTGVDDPILIEFRDRFLDGFEPHGDTLVRLPFVPH